jgi:quercetin 2,3-dioxygenase
MKTIKALHRAVYEPMGDLVTYRAIPTNSVNMSQLDPFIFLNHHGPQVYQRGNAGLPFGPHPHRGFETVTFILQGDLVHKDSSGGGSKISAGGVQWMTAGRGIIHEELSSPEFKKSGGPLEILQLWLNLPSHFKMTQPKYIGINSDAIPVKQWDDGRVVGHILSGTWEDIQGPVHPLTDVHLSWFTFSEEGKHVWNIPKDQSVFCYVVSGSIRINGEDVKEHYLVEFNHDGEVIDMKATTDTVLLFGYATPTHEPIVAYGPFVMNTQEEIQQAYADYRSGRFEEEPA